MPYGQESPGTRVRPGFILVVQGPAQSRFRIEVQTPQPVTEWRNTCAVVGRTL